MDEIFSGVVTGETTASIAAYNSGPGRFGLLEQSLEIKAERAFGNRSPNEDAVKREDARVAAYKPKKVYKREKRKIRTAKTTMTRRRIKKEKISGEETIEVDGYKVLKERIDVPNVPQTISRLRNPRLVDSEIPIPEYDYDDGLRVLEDFSNLVKVASENLPSCCFFYVFRQVDLREHVAKRRKSGWWLFRFRRENVGLTSGEKDEDDEEKEEGGKEKDEAARQQQKSDDEKTRESIQTWR